MSTFYDFDNEKEPLKGNPAPKKGEDEKKVSALLGQLLDDGELDAPTTKETEDDSQSVLSLRNLLRQNKINKSQYVGGLATLVATGLITKSEFTRLKSAVN